MAMFDDGFLEVYGRMFGRLFDSWFGIILLLFIIGYIWARYTGRIGSPFQRGNKGGRSGGSGGISKRTPNLVIRR